MTTAGDHPEIDWASQSWRKAAACGDAGCVEVAVGDDWVAVRDSKAPRQGPLVFTRSEWLAFSDGLKDGQFDVD